VILACRALPKTDAVVAWLGGDEGIADAVGQDLEDLDGWKAYVAGPPAMVDAAMAITTARGLRPQDLHADVFFTPQEADAA